MSAVEIQRTVETPVDRVWATLTDFAAYGRWIPLTRMRVDPQPTRVGWGFAGKTGLGPVGFLDSMIITRWNPPSGGGPDTGGRFAVRKTGRVLGGWADVTVAPTGSGGSFVTWREEIVPKPESVGRLVARATDPVTHRLFATALDQMLAAAEGRETSTPA